MFATYSYYRVLVVAMTYDDFISLFSILIYIFVMVVTIVTAN